jgi:hypothetical protein
MLKKTVLILLFLVLSTLSPSLLAAKDFSPHWWEIKLVLTTDGEYTLEGAEKNYSGDYSFTILWTGTMERDDSDYLLYRINSEILRWEAQEKAIAPDFFRLLQTTDFVDKPFFCLNYILRKEENLHFDFACQGFFVPQNESLDKFFLNLPSSAENSQRLSEVDYDSLVLKGSNHIFLEEKEIYFGPVEKNFSWTWRHKQWLLKENRTVSASNSHKVKVKISIMPHY